MAKKVIKKRKTKLDVAKQKAELDRFGDQFVMGLSTVKKKILNDEKPPDEKKIFDFTWSQGQDVKMGKTEKKSPSDQGLQMSFYNTRSKRYNPPK